MDEKFRIELRKKLEAFRSAKEWSDFISLLSSLDRTLNSYEMDRIADLNLLTKRLNQCLSPALPAGVHTKCLETYQIVFNKFSRENFIKHFNSVTFGFFSSASNLKTMALPNYFNIITEKIVPLGKEVEEFAENILIGILPFLETESSEFLPQALNLIDKFRESIDENVFYDALWDCLDVNQPLRICVINYLFKSNTSKNCNKAEKRFSLAICSSLHDKQISVLRGSLDILINFFPLNEILHFGNLDRITVSVLKLLLLRDLSVNKRIMSWLNLKDENNFELINKGLKILLNEELAMFYRILLTLVDNELLFNYLIDKLILKSLFYLKCLETKKESKEFYFQREEGSEPFKFVEIFFENVDKKIFWNSVEKQMKYILEENFTDYKLKGGKEPKQRSSKSDSTELDEKFYDEKIFSQDEKDILDSNSGKTEKFNKKGTLFEEDNIIKSLEDKVKDFQMKNEEILLNSSNENNSDGEIFKNSSEDDKNLEKETNEYLEDKNENISTDEINLSNNQVVPPIDEGSLDKVEDVSLSEEESYDEEPQKQTLITRSTDEFIELLIYIFDKFNLVNEEIAKEFFPDLILMVTENFFKFEGKNLLLFFSVYKVHLERSDLSISFKKMIKIDDFPLFISILEIFIEYFAFLKHFDAKFWQIFYEKFIKLSPENKLKYSTIFNGLMNHEENTLQIQKIFSPQIFFEDFLRHIDEHSVRYIYVYDGIFNKELERLFLNYIGDLNDSSIDKINNFFYFWYNYLGIKDETFFTALICYCHKFDSIYSFNNSLNSEESLLSNDASSSHKIEKLSPIDTKTKIIELFNYVNNNEVILFLVVKKLEVTENKIECNRTVLGTLNVLKCFVLYSSSFCAYLSKPSKINSITLTLLERLFNLIVNYDVELNQNNFDITVSSLDIINLLIKNETISKNEVINFDMSKVFKFVVEEKNTFLLNKITNLLIISINGFKKSDFTALDVLFMNTNNIYILINVIFKMENKIAQFKLFNKIIELKEKKEIFVVYKTVKFIMENTQFYLKEDVELLISKLISYIDSFISKNKETVTKKEDTLLMKEETNYSELLIKEESSKFIFFYFYVNKIIMSLLNKFSKLVIDKIVTNGLLIHKLRDRNKLYELILKKILTESTYLNYSIELNKHLNKDELKSIINLNKSCLEDIFIHNRKALDFKHYRFIIDLFIKAKKEKDELIIKIFNNFLLYIQKITNYRNNEISENYDLLIKGYKRINYNINLLINILFSLVNAKERELKERNLEIIYELSDKINIKYIWEYFTSNDFFVDQIHLKFKLMKKYAKEESMRFGDLFAKIDQGFYLTRESELLNKQFNLKRAAFLMLTSEVDQCMSYFPKILEKLIELINFDVSLRKIFFLLLRVIIVKNNHSRLNNLWPSLFNEIFRFIDTDSYDIFKFLDTLFVINSGETKEFQSKFFIKKSYKKVYYEGKGLEENEVMSDQTKEDTIFNILKNNLELMEQKDLLLIPMKRRHLLPSKKDLNKDDIKEYLTHVSYYYKHMDEYTNEIDYENLLNDILNDFEE